MPQALFQLLYNYILQVHAESDEVPRLNTVEKIEILERAGNDRETLEDFDLGPREMKGRRIITITPLHCSHAYRNILMYKYSFSLLFS